MNKIYEKSTEHSKSNHRIIQADEGSPTLFQADHSTL